MNPTTAAALERLIDQNGLGDVLEGIRDIMTMKATALHDRGDPVMAGMWERGEAALAQLVKTQVPAAIQFLTDRTEPSFSFRS